jgi:hypothetical protein
MFIIKHILFISLLIAILSRDICWDTNCYRQPGFRGSNLKKPLKMINDLYSSEFVELQSGG